MQVITYIIDTFTSANFKGNPTGVCYSEEEMDQSTMQSIAGELNFPVTAFISRHHSYSNEYSIKYYTPTTGIPACGHATLAAAQVALMEDAMEASVFHTIDGIRIKTVSEGNMIFMSYPKYDVWQYEVEQEILDSLQLSNYKNAGVSDQLEALFIELDNPSVLRAIQPDYFRLLKSNNIIKEVVITSVADDREHDYLLRSFCPWIGINEDPVTGSVHSVLAGYWKERLNKNILKAYQASERGGELLVKAFDDKVEIGGENVVVLKGKMMLPE
ncbi:MAG TPA: PhzF family phenazine biosynthesis protein [Chitinophagaceae bacterium]